MSEGKAKTGKVLAILGIALALVAVFADSIGIGAASGFGWKQGLALVVGIGLVVYSKKSCCSGGASASAETESTPDST